MTVDVEHLAGENIRAASGISFPLIIPLIFVTISLALTHLYLQTRRIARLGNKIPGPPTLPIIGNAHYVWNKTHNGRKKNILLQFPDSNLILLFSKMLFYRNFGIGS